MLSDLAHPRSRHLHFVVFTDGLQKVAPDEFVAWYGAGDTNVGAVRFKVIISPAAHSRDFPVGA